MFISSTSIRPSRRPVTSRDVFKPRFRLHDDEGCTPHLPASLPNPACLELSYYNQRSVVRKHLVIVYADLKRYITSFYFSTKKNDHIDIQICHYVRFALAIDWHFTVVRWIVKIEQINHKQLSSS